MRFPARVAGSRAAYPLRTLRRGSQRYGRRAARFASCSRALSASALVCVSLAANLDTNSALAADTKQHVALLKLESAALHDPLTARFDERLRARLSERTGSALHDTQASLGQMSLAQDCNVAQAQCLDEIAQSFEVQALIFGSVSLDPSPPTAVVHYFDVQHGTLDRSSEITFSSHDAADEELAHEAERVVTELLGPEATLAAEVTVAPPVSARQELEVAEQEQAQVSTLTAPESADAMLAHPTSLPPPRELAPPPAAAPSVAPARPQPRSGLNGRQIAGIALLGGAALSVGLSVLSFVHVERADEDDDLQRYRKLVGQRANEVRDVCDEASLGRRYGLETSGFSRVQSTCDTGSTFEALQFVFIGTAVVSGGLGAYFLATGSAAERQQPAIGSRTIRVGPSLARRSIGVGARIKF